MYNYHLAGALGGIPAPTVMTAVAGGSTAGSAGSGSSSVSGSQPQMQMTEPLISSAAGGMPALFASAGGMPALFRACPPPPRAALMSGAAAALGSSSLAGASSSLTPMAVGVPSLAAGLYYHHPIAAVAAGAPAPVAASSAAALPSTAGHGTSATTSAGGLEVIKLGGGSIILGGEEDDDQETMRCHLHSKPQLSCKFCRKYKRTVHTQARLAQAQLAQHGFDDKRNAIEMTNTLTFNVNNLLRENILSSEYFKSLYSLKTYTEVVDEIYQFADHAEPYCAGNSRAPSTLFCCIYKFFLMKLTEKQVHQLINHIDSPYIRCAGFLFLRYVNPPEKLWGWYEPFFIDNEEFTPGIDKQKYTTMGEYVESLITEDKYFSTVLPRLPVKIKNQYGAQLIAMDEHRSRKKANLARLKEIGVYGMKVDACSNGDWLEGIVLDVVDNGPGRTCLLVKLEDDSQEEIDIGLISVRPKEEEEVPPPPPHAEVAEADNRNPHHHRDLQHQPEKRKHKHKHHKKRSRSRNGKSSVDGVCSDEGKKESESGSGRRRSSRERELDKRKENGEANATRGEDRGRDGHRTKKRDHRDRSQSGERHSSSHRHSSSRHHKHSSHHHRDHHRSHHRRDASAESKSTRGSRSPPQRSRSRSRRKHSRKHRQTARNTPSPSVASASSVPSAVTSAVLETANKGQLPKTQEELLHEFRRREREKALATGKDYARRPTSYKSSLSLKLEQGVTRKKAKSPSPATAQPPAARKTLSPYARPEKKKEPSAEHKQKMAQLMEKYSKGPSDVTKANRDVEGPDVMRLG